MAVHIVDRPCAYQGRHSGSIIPASKLIHDTGLLLAGLCGLTATLSSAYSAQIVALAGQGQYFSDPMAMPGRWQLQPKYATEMTSTCFHVAIEHSTAQEFFHTTHLWLLTFAEKRGDNLCHLEQHP